MKKWISILSATVIAFSILAGCGSATSSLDNATTVSAKTKKSTKKKSSRKKAGSSKKSTRKDSRTVVSKKTKDTVTIGTRTDRGFIVDNTLHSQTRGDIHYSSYIPDSYTGKEKYALFISLPGWEGEYFQGVGANLVEFFPFEAEKYNDRMIIISPQLNGWDEASADDTIALTEYLLATYNIDRSRVYLEGYSGGGETGSVAVSKRPDLYTAWLMGSSQWDGDYDSIVNARIPVYLAVGEHDSYYGSGPLKKAYRELHRRYVKKGLSENQIDRLLVLDVKPASYFTSQGFDDQHAGGQLFARDKTIMSWLFSQRKK